MMTGRERIEQAAKENGWNSTAESVKTNLYWTEGARLWIRYTPTGSIQWVEGTGDTPFRNRLKCGVGQVIAYLQEHKENN